MKLYRENKNQGDVRFYMSHDDGCDIDIPPELTEMSYLEFRKMIADIAAPYLQKMFLTGLFWGVASSIFAFVIAGLLTFLLK